MPAIIEYIEKFSISITLIFLFYQLVLRRLTFYHLNRWYFLACILLSLFIPLININPLLEQQNMLSNDVVLLVPTVQHYSASLQQVADCPVPVGFSNWTKWDWIQLALLIGTLFFAARILVRYLSFRRLRSQAQLIAATPFKIYQVNKSIIPFSFGNAVYLNQSLHTDKELNDIVHHEFVHVRQKHSVDIILAEILLALNWYNPFAWALRKSIRQNLEFIADDQVLQTGMDRKEYQYLLLKVIGNNHFSIANNFNFSSLRKRIAMMNKLKTSRLQLLRFILLLPAISFLLLAFRESRLPALDPQSAPQQTLDTIPKKANPASVINDYGYSILIVDDRGNCTVEVRNKDHKQIERVLLTEWISNRNKYEGKYGTMPDNELEKKAAPASTSSTSNFVFSADQFLWTTGKAPIRLIGNAVMTDLNSDIRFSSDSIELYNPSGLLFINGKEAERDKVYTTIQGEKYHLKVLETAQAINKYGARAAAGVIEINSL